MENEILNEPNYIEELVALIRNGDSRDKLAEELTNYHDNDISNALDELDEGERRVLYHILDDERISEIFAYLEDLASILGSWNSNVPPISLRTWMPMTRWMFSRKSMRRRENS